MLSKQIIVCSALLLAAAVVAFPSGNNTQLEEIIIHLN